MCQANNVTGQGLKQQKGENWKVRLTLLSQQKETYRVLIESLKLEQALNSSRVVSEGSVQILTGNLQKEEKNLL